MKRPFSFFAFNFCVLCFVLAAAVSGQTPQPTATPIIDDPGATKIFEVRLPVTVTEKKKLVSGLGRNDFAIFEDGVQQEVTFFSDEKTNPPVFVGVLMDTSPSSAGKINFSKEAAKNFIFTVTRLRKDKAAFMTFDHDITSTTLRFASSIARPLRRIAGPISPAPSSCPFTSISKAMTKRVPTMGRSSCPCPPSKSSWATSVSPTTRSS